MEMTEAFGIALKRIRLRQGLTQEDFGLVSSRTYISSLERGTKKVRKACELAKRLGVHPMTLSAECFLVQDKAETLEGLLQSTLRERPS
ncbi:MAG: helix-turn-helix transcriptional regulator [Pseudomonas sp.]|uniref:helix-turn-helix transcriptional regulator n=1 Tax=Pseudomonas sp. TaxID=306 RepID=UPI003D6DCC72